MNILFCLMAFVFAEEKLSADIFDLEGKNKIYTFESQRQYGKEVMTYTATFKDAESGEVVASEKAEINKGQIVKYDVARLPMQEIGVIEVKEGKLHFTYKEKNSSSQSKENLKPDTLISATLVPFLESRLEDLMAKKEITFRYAVWFRKETVGFQFSLERMENEQLVIKMNPTNFLYKSLVNPIYFTFEKSTKKLLTIKGRILPKVKVGSSWKDFDGLVIYK